MTAASEATEEMKQLAEAARLAALALKAGEASAKALEEKLSKLGELTIRAGLGGEVAEKFGHIKKAFGLAGDESLTMGQRARAGAAGMKMLAGTALGAVSDLAAYSQSILRANAELFEHDRRVRALGAAHLAMQQETAGATEVTAAFALQQALASRGVEQNAQTMTVLGRAMREHANARAVSQTEASQTIQQAFDGDAAAASRLGVSLTGATTASQRHALIVQQLTASQRGSAIETRNAAEEARIQGEVLDRAASGWKAVVSNAPGWGALQFAVSGVSGAIERLRGANAATDAQTQRTTASLRTETAERARARAITDEATAATLRGLREQRMMLAAQHTDLRDSSGATHQLAQAQREYEAAVRRTHAADALAAGRSPEERARRGIALLQDEIGKRNQINQLRSQADASRSAERELGALAAQVRSRGLVVGLEVRSVPIRQRLNELLAEAANLAQREGESREQFVGRAQAALQAAEGARAEAEQRARAANEQRVATRDLATEQRRAWANEIPLIQIQRERFESYMDFTRRAIELQRANTDEIVEAREAEALATAEFVIAARTRATEARKTRDEQLAAARQTQASTDALKAAERRADAEDFRQRSSLDVQLREQYGLSALQLQTDAQRSAELTKTLTGTLSEMGQGAAQALMAAAASGEDAGAALAKYVDEWAAGKAIQWGMQSIEAFASAGLAYFIRPDAVPGLLISGATFAGLAAGAGIATAAIPNAPSGGGGGGSGGGAGKERLASAGGSSSPAGQGGQVSYTININSLTAAGPETSAALSRAINQGNRYGVGSAPTRLIPRNL